MFLEYRSLANVCKRFKATQLDAYLKLLRTQRELIDKFLTYSVFDILSLNNLGEIPFLALKRLEK